MVAVSAVRGRPPAREAGSSASFLSYVVFCWLPCTGSIRCCRRLCVLAAGCGAADRTALWLFPGAPLLLCAGAKQMKTMTTP
ncbi:hypothetical protein BRADI_3g14722v3 [Brachypodium distachyon]|uniref:Uncharacterized protein n=1 Tax=Brachypodium distachyon TaxID=15368 RepID=A0A0Q3F5S4_BRADI|nr:hypothetical protein BRADI_3g14722v3 [Brachypodium distachyon]